MPESGSRKLKSSSLILIFAAIALAIILIIGYIEQNKIITPPVDNSSYAWMNIELKDVITGKTFKLSDFSGQPIMLESFAVWCPTCLQQQKEINSLIQDEKIEIIHISLDTDPNEDENAVIEHAQDNDFNWRFSVAPNEFTQALINDFGLRIVDAASVPIVLICDDGSAQLLARGLKSSDKLISEIEKRC